MLKLKGFFRTIIIVMLLMLVISSVVIAQETKEDIQIGMVVRNLGTTTNKRVEEAFVKQAKEFGWKVQVIDGAVDFERMNRAIDSFITSGVDGIINNMCDPELIERGIQRAKMAGIPIINISAGVHPDVVCNITPNEYESAAVLGAYVLNRLLKEGNTDIAIIHHTDHDVIRKRYQTFKTMLIENPWINLTEHVNSDPWLEDSRAFTRTFLDSNPDFKGAIWASFDEPAAGASLGVEEAGREKDIFVTGTDGNLWVFEDYIAKGKPFVATMAVPYEAMAELAAFIMKDVLFEEKYPVLPEIYVPSKLITQDNVPPTGEYPEFEIPSDY